MLSDGICNAMISVALVNRRYDRAIQLHRFFRSHDAFVHMKVTGAHQKIHRGIKGAVDSSSGFLFILDVTKGTSDEGVRITVDYCGSVHERENIQAPPIHSKVIELCLSGHGKAAVVEDARSTSDAIIDFRNTSTKEKDDVSSYFVVLR